MSLLFQKRIRDLWGIERDEDKEEEKAWQDALEEMKGIIPRTITEEASRILNNTPTEKQYEKAIKKMKFETVEVSKYTGFLEMLSGRIKTIHPKIYAGILNIRNNKNHKKNLKKLNIQNIDLVIVNFYPFEKKSKKEKILKN